MAKRRAKPMKPQLPEIRPGLMLERKYLPDEVAQAKPGKTVRLEIEAKVVSKREDLDRGRAVMVEIKSVKAKQGGVRNGRS